MKLFNFVLGKSFFSLPLRCILLLVTLRTPRISQPKADYISDDALKNPLICYHFADPSPSILSFVHASSKYTSNYLICLSSDESILSSSFPIQAIFYASQNPYPFLLSPIYPFIYLIPNLFSITAACTLPLSGLTTLSSENVLRRSRIETELAASRKALGTVLRMHADG